MSKSQIKAELDVLTQLENGEVVTQAALSQRVGVAVGLINMLLKRGMHKGYVKARSAPYKRYAYYLTPKGFSEKSRLLALYLEYSMDFFREARQQYDELYRQARLRGLKRVVLVGSGELAEIAVIAAIDSEITLAALVDPGSNRATQYGLQVLSVVDDIRDADAAIITDAKAAQATYAAVRAAHPDLPVLAPPLLHITFNLQGEVAP